MNPWTPGEVFMTVLAAIGGTFALTIVGVHIYSVFGSAYSKAEKEELDRIRRFEEKIFK